MNYFELFEIPVSLIPDQSKLSSRYPDLQKKYREDSLSNGGQETGEMAENLSAIEKGFKILNDPGETTKYVLLLKGMLKEEEKYELPVDFLNQMMELSEGLKDDDILNLEELETKMFQHQNNLYHEVRHIFEGYNDDTVTPGQLLQVKDYYFKKKYLEGILERLEGIRNIAR